MLEIIEEVVRSEQAAEELIADAREEVQRSQSAFEAEERRRLQEAKATADARVRDRLTAIREEAESTHQKRIAEARSRADSFVAEHADEIEAAVRDAERLVVETVIRGTNR